jgi:hypothetical protein
MVTFQVQIPDGQKVAFQQLMESLKSMGIVSAYELDNLVLSGEPMSIQHLLAVLSQSEEQVREQKTIPSEQVIDFFKSWKRQNA